MVWNHVFFESCVGRRFGKKETNSVIDLFTYTDVSKGFSIFAKNFESESLICVVCQFERYKSVIVRGSGAKGSVNLIQTLP